MSKGYSLDKSPLYRMRNRRKLARLLGLPEKYFAGRHEYLYRDFTKPKSNGKGERRFLDPPDELKVIQKRICRLLMRIETPDWLKSGKKKQSYITNAEQHLGNNFVKTMDISQYYDSVNRQHIYKMFTDIFLMEKDIAWLMTDLVTCYVILPTGSPSSQLIAYWSYSKMFVEIHEIAAGMGCEFTMYVDDMTFSSSNPIPKELREKVESQLRENGLHAKRGKDHYYQADKTKVITGVGVKDGKKVVLNKKRKDILDLYEQCKETKNLKDIERLRGKLCSQRQIEPEIFPEVDNFIKHYEKDLKHMSRERCSKK